MELKTNIKELQEYGITKISQLYQKSDIDNMISLVDAEAKTFGINLWSKSSCNITEDIWIELRRKINYGGVVDAIRKNVKLNFLAKEILGIPVKNFGINKIRINIPSFSTSIHPWHQDEWTWPKLRNKNPITIVTPLTRMNKSNGIEFAKIKGLKKMLIHDRDDYKAEIMEKSIINDATIISPDLSPGDVMVFDPYIIHRSIPNINSYPRISLDIRFFR